MILTAKSKPEECLKASCLNMIHRYPSLMVGRAGGKELKTVDWTYPVPGGTRYHAYYFQAPPDVALECADALSVLPGRPVAWQTCMGPAVKVRGRKIQAQGNISQGPLLIMTVLGTFRISNVLGLRDLGC